MPTTFDEEADAFLSQVGKPPAANSFDDEADALLASVGKTVPIKMTLGIRSTQKDFADAMPKSESRPSALGYFGASAAQGTVNFLRSIDQTVSDVFNGTGDSATRQTLVDAGLMDSDRAAQMEQFAAETKRAERTAPIVDMPPPESPAERIGAGLGAVVPMVGAVATMAGTMKATGVSPVLADAIAFAAYDASQGGSEEEIAKSGTMGAAFAALQSIPAAKYGARLAKVLSESPTAVRAGEIAGEVAKVGTESAMMGLPGTIEGKPWDENLVDYLFPPVMKGSGLAVNAYKARKANVLEQLQKALTADDVVKVVSEVKPPEGLVLLTPETAVKFVAENPEAAAKLASVAERPSRKVFREAGFDGELSTAERDVFMQMVRAELGKKQAETQGLVDQQTQQATERLNTEAPPPTPDAAEVGRLNQIAQDPGFDRANERAEGPYAPKDDGRPIQQQLDDAFASEQAATDAADASTLSMPDLRERAKRLGVEITYDRNELIARIKKAEQDAKPAETTTPTKEATDGQEAQAQGRQEGLLTEQQKSEPPAPDTPAHGVPDGAFALKNEFTSQVRKDLGLNTLNSPERFTRQMAIDEAMKTGKVEQVDAIAQEVLQAPRALTPVETAAFDVRGARLSQSRRELVNKLKTLTEKTDIDATVAEIGRIEDSLDTLTMASTATGTESGRSLQARKNAFNYNADPVVVRARARLAKGGELTVPQAEMFNNLSKRVEEATQRMTKIEERMKERNVAQVLSEVKERRKGESKQVKDMEMSDLMRRAKELLDGGCLDV